MAEEEEKTEVALPIPGIDLSEIAPSDAEEGSAKTKALVPFDPLQRYLADIRRFKILSREEEHDLAVQYK